MNIIFLAYRDWALRAANEVAKKFPSNSYYFFHSEDEFENHFFSREQELKKYIAIAIGWSWLIPKKIVDSILCLGLHPSDLPSYRGGSPIQHQIIDGVIDSKMSLFELKSGIDNGPIWGKSELSLRGDSMEEIFNNFTLSSIENLTTFFNEYPNINPAEQDIGAGSYCGRRSGNESQLQQADFDFANLIPLYNKIRCLTDPYPNAFIEDEIGNRIYFQKIKFMKADHD
jgi:methionyl-tRNA formyltransferase